MIGVFCPKEKRIPFLDSFFEERITYQPAKFIHELKAVAAFGNDSSIQQGRKLANKKSIPFYIIHPGLSPLFIEDNQALFDYQYSYLISKDDYNGINQELEYLLNHTNLEPCLLEKAKNALDVLNQKEESSEFIVLIDQKADEGTNDQAAVYKKMLDEALRTYSKHPIKIISFFSGNGYLKGMCQDSNVEYIENTLRAKKLLKSAKKVMVVDALEGFIPLLFHKEVHCFGQPFYSGWGLTKDEIESKEHSSKRTILELFTTVFYLYEKQINPLTGLPTDLNDILELTHDQSYMNAKEENKRVYCFGIQPWKRGFVRPFVKSPSNTVLFPKSAHEVSEEIDENSDLLVWGHKEPADVRELAARLNKPIMRIEDGFIRSVGLGTNVTLPWSLALDHKGIYYNPQEVSELESILNHQIFTENMINDAKKIRQKIVENQLTKYNSEPIETLQLPSEGKKVILVPGQVEDDASIRYGCKDIKTNTDLLNCVREHNPDAYIIYKPHPDIVSKNRQGEVTSDFITDACDHIEIEASIISCIQYADEVHTMTSLTGFDALLRDKKVFTYGSPFYSGWGLTEDRHTIERRTRSLTLDELIAGALLVYPRYYDWENKIRVSCDTVVEKLIAKRNNIFKEGQIKQVNIPNRIKKVGFLLKELMENH